MADLDDDSTEVNGDSISELMGIAVSMGFSEEITSHALADMRRRGKNFNLFVISTSSYGAPGKLILCLGLSFMV